jgi:hypothetical protein
MQWSSVLEREFGAVFQEMRLGAYTTWKVGGAQNFLLPEEEKLLASIFEGRSEQNFLCGFLVAEAMFFIPDKG